MRPADITSFGTATPETQNGLRATDNGPWKSVVSGLCILLALLDTEKAYRELETRYIQADQDRILRLETIEKVNKQLTESEADRAARLETIQELNQQLSKSEAGRAASSKAGCSCPLRTGPGPWPSSLHRLH